jgi:shikimate kinase
LPGLANIQQFFDCLSIVDGIQLETFRRKEHELLVELEAAKQTIAEMTSSTLQQQNAAVLSTETQVFFTLNYRHATLVTRVIYLFVTSNCGLRVQVLFQEERIK